MSERKMKYRLGLDLGTNSIGWCMLRLNDNKEPVAVIKAGVRIFHDGRNEKDKSPLAVSRRNARGMRRNLDRKISRRNHLLHRLIKYNLFPESIEECKKLSILNPYELRNKAVNEKIELYELGRILMHISKRRGFKSNRKVDKQDDSGKIKPAIAKLKQEMEKQNCKTAGAYLYYLLKNHKPVRARLGKVDGKEGYEIYLDRAVMEEEYNIIMAEQKKYHKELTDEVINELFDIIFYQRPLKAQKVGKCRLNPNECRLHKAHVLAQDFILLQRVNDLRVYDDNIMNYRPLSDDEKKIVKRELNRKKEMKYESVRNLLKKYFENGKYGMFTHEATSKTIQGNKTNAVMGSKDILGEKWENLTDEEKFNIIESILSDITNDELIEYLKNNYLFTSDDISKIVDKAIYKLDTGYISYGKTAVTDLNNIMDKDNLDLHHAREKAGYEEKTNHIASDELKYYGEILEFSVINPQIDNPKNDEERYGKIANPTVHAALNQLRKLVNELIKLYGKPEQIVIELARDLKNNQKVKDRYKKINAENQAENEKVKKIIDEYAETYKTVINNNKEIRDKVKLWLELGENEIDRVCVYTGEKISVSKLFSDEVQVEHIVPYSKTLDDSFNNKTLSMKRANYYKGNRTPYEAFKDSKDGYNYNEIIERAKVFNKKNDSKFKRFQQDAMELYNKNGDFIARQLTDTQYISRLATTYLKSLYDSDNESSIWSIPGQLTAMIRGKLGLNSLISKDDNKNRNDHRHHAIDAFVVAITTRSFLQKISTASAICYDKNKISTKLLESMPEPFHNYRAHIERAVNNINTSHKIDRSISGQLHEDTAYGMINNNKDGYNVVTRWPLDKFKEKRHYEAIRDIELRSAAINNMVEFNKLIEERKIKNIRILKKEDPLVKIYNKENIPYKAFAPGSNLCVEIYEYNGKCYSEVIQLFDAAQKNFKPKWVSEKENAKLVYRLFKGDIIGYIDLKEGRDIQYYIIKGINQVNNNLKLMPINCSTDEFRKGFNALFNDLNAIHYSISVSGIISKKKTPSIDFWNKH